MSTPLTRRDKITGGLVGGALGDAIGAHFEGKPAGIEFVIPSTLQITDDTQLTIATCEAILERRQVDPESIAQHFLRWYRQRKIRGIGSSTLKALTDLDAGGHWALVGAMGEQAAGNGAAMRIAPIAYLLDPDQFDDRRLIRDVCRITHRHDEAYLGGLVIVRAIRHVLLHGMIDATVIRQLAESLPDSQIRDRLVEYSTPQFRFETAVKNFPTTGFVVDTVPLAILAAVEVATGSISFLQMIEKIALCGGDTDTIGSLFGQIHGTQMGLNQLPLHVFEQIEECDLIMMTATQFATFVASESTPDSSVQRV